MKMQLKINKQFPPLTKIVKVKDDWYPCFENNTVKVSLMVLYAGWNDKYPYYIKFQAWGADDFGLEKEKLFTDFDQIIIKSNITLYRKLWIKIIFIT